MSSSRELVPKTMRQSVVKMAETEEDEAIIERAQIRRERRLQHRERPEEGSNVGESR